MQVNIADAKTNLSRYLTRVKGGETIVICERNIPIAELRPLAVSTTGRRSLEPIWPGWEVPAAFFEPLPDDILKAFEGELP